MSRRLPASPEPLPAPHDCRRLRNRCRRLQTAGVSATAAGAFTTAGARNRCRRLQTLPASPTAAGAPDRCWRPIAAAGVSGDAAGPTRPLPASPERCRCLDDRCRRLRNRCRCLTTAGSSELRSVEASPKPAVCSPLASPRPLSLALPLPVASSPRPAIIALRDRRLRARCLRDRRSACKAAAAHLRPPPRQLPLVPAQCARAPARVARHCSVPLTRELWVRAARAAPAAGRITSHKHASQNANCFIGTSLAACSAAVDNSASDWTALQARTPCAKVALSRRFAEIRCSNSRLQRSLEVTATLGNGADAPARQHYCTPQTSPLRLYPRRAGAAADAPTATNPNTPQRKRRECPTTKPYPPRFDPPCRR